MGPQTGTSRRIAESVLAIRIIFLENNEESQ